ncbi:hypothetical protein B0H14DRAFT_3480283 [Mycena olivaceomarginata]|nr:hypothetical protein B0H14DRAFT_3480283 [Mycena olivaceomarginata]
MVENPHIDAAWRRQQNGLNPCPHGTPQFFPDGFRPPPWNAPSPPNPGYLMQWAPGYPPQTPYTSGFNRNTGMGPFGLDDDDDDDFPRPWPGRWDAPPVLADRFQAVVVVALQTVLVLLAVLALQAMGPPSFPGPMQMVPFPSSPFPNMPMVLFPSSPFPRYTNDSDADGANDPDDAHANDCLGPTTHPLHQERSFPRAPGDWRYDYNPPRRFRLPSLRRKSGDRSKPPLEHCHLSPILLMPSSKTPVLSFDLRAGPPLRPREPRAARHARPALQPPRTSRSSRPARPVAQLRFYHPRLPWYVDVRAAQPNGVLVADVLHQLHAALHRPIRAHDFANRALSAADREAHHGRVDFMGPDVILQGFVEGKNGMWLMKTTRYGRGG